jgi:hypothetical protein
MFFNYKYYGYCKLKYYGYYKLKLTYVVCSYVVHQLHQDNRQYHYNMMMS